MVLKHANNIEPTETTFQIELEIGNDESDPRLVHNRPFEVKIDKDDNLYILDVGDNRIVKLSGQGEYLAEIGKKGRGPGEFISPHFFDIDDSGRIYIYDLALRRISILDNQFRYLHSLSVEAPLGDMTVDSKGNLFLLLREPYKHKGMSAYLWRYGKENEYRQDEAKLLLTQEMTYEIGGPPGNVIVSSMEVSSSDELFFCFFNKYYVRKFSNEGTIMSAFTRDIKNPKLPDFWHQELEKEKSNPRQNYLRDEFKIPDDYPNLVEKLLVDHKTGKVYIVTTEGIEYLKSSNGQPVADRMYIDQYDMHGNLEKRFKVSVKGYFYSLQSVQDGKFICIIVMSPENDLVPKIVRCSLN